VSLAALLGLQWGDEGKGKVVDVLGPETDFVVRAQGGANAGHTVQVAGRTHVLHLVPSGILHPRVTAVIANGVVVDLEALVGEITTLEAAGVDVRPRLWISDRAHVVLPWHSALDAALESARGEGALGTTRRGIGPAYSDKAARTGIRLGEFRDEARFRERVRAEAERKAPLLAGLGARMADAREVADRALAAYARLAPMVTDTVDRLGRAVAEGRAVLLEGAQGALLDVDLGTYPFVTSSTCHVGGLLAGAGLPARALGRVIGVTKAYCTRVGSGPFPSEIPGAQGDRLREAGREYGATTGRPRRCGWLDLVALRYAARTNGVDRIALTKLDVLAGLGPVRVVAAYRLRGRVIHGFPSSEDLPHVEPVLEDVGELESPPDPGAGVAGLGPLARELIRRIEEATLARVDLVSVGAGRDETLRR
jgi:adenylosuccinate synthase